jgi:acyl transferase domain-containing protein/thioesterase domain-containing protein
VPWLLSAPDKAALRAQARSLADALAGRAEPTVLDIGFSLAVTRATHESRAALVAHDRTGLHIALRALGTGRPDPGVLLSTAGDDNRLVVLFPGQGAQRAGMGTRLAERFPAFRAAYGKVCQELDQHLPVPLRSVVDDSAQPGLLDRTDFTQAALFAYEVALYRLLESVGVRADHLAGHSVGEVSAAHVAGVLSLADAARLVAARGRLMAGLATGGAMFSVRAPLAEVKALLARTPGRVCVAAINGPTDVVISGDLAAATEIAADLAGAGRRTTRLRVSHAFHSPLMEPMLDDFRTVVGQLTFHRPTLRIVSTVTGAPATDEIRTPDYWVRQARDTVLFGAALTRLAEAGATTFLEVGPGATLTALAEANLPAQWAAGCVAAVPDVSVEDAAVLTALARLHVRGIPIDWSTVYAASGARRCELPTYAFQRRRYWLDAPPAATGGEAAHPLLGPPVPSADAPQVRHTGELSVSSLPWLAGHSIGGAVLVPATAFVEMALGAARQQGASRLDELTILAPLALPEGAAPQVQVVVGGGDAAGRHLVEIFARPGSGASAWTKHATGLIAGNGRAPEPDVAVWPPPGAKPVALDGAYERLAAQHYRYDGMFRAVTAAWRHGGDLYAEVSLPDGAAGHFALHPVLLDAALHVGLLAAAVQDGGSAEVRAPFAFEDVELYATGTDAVRVHLSPTDTGTAVTLTDRSGRPVASIGSLTTRPLDLRDSVPAYRLRWVPIPLPGPATDGTPAGHALLTVPPAVEGTDPMVRTRKLIAELLPALQRSLDDADRGARLVVVTRDATTDDPDLAVAALWGMVRSAQAENPGQIMLVDLDGSDTSRAALDRVLALDEPQIAIRDGVAYVPRLTALEETADELSPVGLAGTVLVTGGTGALGSLLARHLVTAHRVRRLVLAGRRGAEAAGADALAAGLAGSGAEVQIVACDLSDPAAVEKLVSNCGPDLTAVFHLAGVLDDGVLGTLTPERMDTVLAPKAGAAWVLHTATQHLDLSAFVLYSSASGLFGRPGQANYAAANSFLDALARHRVARGLPARSLVWGLWDTASDDKGMGNKVATRHLRDGMLPITPRQGTALLERALRNTEPVPVLVTFDLAALRDNPGIPPLLQGIRPLRPPAPVADNDTAETEIEAPGAWQRLLAQLPTAQRQPALTDLLTTELAAVLGHPDAASFPAGRRFTDLGFDSLSAIQLRNRISFLAGVRLPGTIVFDQPTLPELTAYVHAALSEHLADRPTSAGSGAVAYDFASLYHRIINTQGAAEAMAMRFLASYALPSFTAAERDEHAVPPVRLTSGGHGPLLVYLPSYLNLMPGSPRRLVEGFDGHAGMVMLEYPGMRGDPAVPDSPETLARMCAEAIRRVAGDEPVVLAGFCVGGNVAHAVASMLERTGPRPAGIVLLDSHQPADSRRDDRHTALMAWGAGLPGEQFRRLFDDSVIVAGGAYSRLFDAWRPEPVTVPTLLIRAERPTAEMRAADLADWRPRWPLPHDTIDVPGDHWTLIDQDAATTAAAIPGWLRSLPAEDL